MLLPCYCHIICHALAMHSFAMPLPCWQIGWLIYWLIGWLALAGCRLIGLGVDVLTTGRHLTPT
jgi:hypothetical protein